MGRAGNAAVKTAAAGVVVLAILALVNGPGRVPRLFVNGPQVPLKGSVEVEPPMLWIRSSPLWDGERRRAVLFIEDDPDRHAIEVRTSYDPVGGEPRVSLLGPDPGIPWPADAERPEDWPAVLVCAAPGADGFGVVRTALSIPMFLGQKARFYLAGKTMDGFLGAIPLVTDASLVDELTRVPTHMPPDLDNLIERRGIEGVIELRITRHDDGATYRFGHGPGTVGPRWSGGVVTVGARQVREGVGLEALSAYLRQRFETEDGPRAFVMLQIGTGVTYLEVLRAMECGRGDPEIQFALFDESISLSDDHELPRPSNGEHDSLLIEESECVRLSKGFLNLYEDGRMKIRGETVPEDVEARLRSSGRRWIFVRATRGARYTDLRRVVRAARSVGMTVELAFAWADPQIHEERTLRLSAPGSAERTVEFTLGDADIDPSGADVRFTAPDDAVVQDIYDAILELVYRGAIGIDLR